MVPAAGPVQDHFDQIVEESLELGRVELLRHPRGPLLMFVDQPPRLVNDPGFFVQPPGLSDSPLGWLACILDQRLQLLLFVGNEALKRESPEHGGAATEEVIALGPLIVPVSVPVVQIVQDLERDT